MKKIWEWLKKNWKWLILPLWIASLILVWLFRGGAAPFFSGTKDSDADTAMKAKDQAIADFRAKLEELAKKAEERLKNASKEQVDEFNGLKDKPLDEVASWIDKLS